MLWYIAEIERVHSEIQEVFWGRIDIILKTVRQVQEDNVFSQIKALSLNYFALFI